MLPLVGFLPADDPRVLATIDATVERLTDERGLVHRYRSHDGLEGEEGTFLLCTFWLAQALAQAGQPVRARAVFERAAAFVNEVGLLAEEVDPPQRGSPWETSPRPSAISGSSTGLGNFRERNSDRNQLLKLHPIRQARRIALRPDGGRQLLRCRAWTSTRAARIVGKDWLPCAGRWLSTPTERSCGRGHEARSGRGAGVRCGPGQGLL